jgi:uncharacterized protein involved in exopolysaccharide biosynthesis
LDDEIDLRPYFQALLLSWRWILGVTLAAATAAVGVSFLIAPTYESAALVAVTAPRQLVQFDPRFEAVDEIRPLNAYPELATSDEMLARLLDDIGAPVESIETVRQLQRVAEAESGSDPSLVRLTIRLGNPIEAARVANKWAETVVTQVNEIYGDQGGEQVAYFEGQLREAGGELGMAESALIEFQSRNRSSIIDDQLVSMKLEHADSLARQREMRFLIQDISELRDQIAERSANNPPAFSDQLTALLLQLTAYGNGEMAQVQIQLDTSDLLTGIDRDQQRALLEGLIEGLVSRAAQLEERLLALEPQILALQQELQKSRAEGDHLLRDREIANETYIALARKVEEERITSQDTSSGVRLASRAAVPEEPISPRKSLNAVISGAVAGLLTTVGIIINIWWRRQDQNPARQSEDTASGSTRALIGGEGAGAGQLSTDARIASP